MNATQFAKMVALNVAATLAAMWIINRIPQLRAIVKGS